MTIERLNKLPILFDRLALDSLTKTQRKKIAEIDACLPQTQCGLCDHPEGCLPYATAIVVSNEPHNKCVPGGQPVSNAIAALLNRPQLKARPSQWPINPITQRPTEVRAVIREDDCIGCTKCIPACPVDAIVGTGKHMHTIFPDLCTGCELCLPPCPVDCIDLVAVADSLIDDSIEHREHNQNQLRQRYHNHLNRVTAQLTDSTYAKPVTSMVESRLGSAAQHSLHINEDVAKATIEAAKLRTKIKKLEKQLRVRHNESKQVELNNLKQQLAQMAQ